MFDMTYMNTKDEQHITSYEGYRRPPVDVLRLKEVLQIDVSGNDLQTAKNMGLPIAMHRPYTRYQGDLAKFIWDNL